MKELHALVDFENVQPSLEALAKLVPLGLRVETSEVRDKLGFSDPAKVEKWFRRNCNDVAGRECTAGEKADVLAWLISLKP